jgi:hypothetical protein
MWVLQGEKRIVPPSARRTEKYPGQREFGMIPHMRDAFATLLIVLASIAAAPAGFAPVPEFHERTKWITIDGGVRVHANAPAEFNEKKPTLLIIYATPNGNTIEQTLGCAKADNLDWHFDIQHIAAQTRRLREIDASHNIVLAVTDTPKRSWPAFRQANADAGAIIRAVVDAAAKDLPRSSLKIVLTGHSGGGSFIFGYLNAVEAIPDSIQRIAFLDANYGYDDGAKHGEKLLAWLRGDGGRRLIVVAYDDREITFDGKKVVGPTGGTFRATGRMLDRFKKELDVKEAREGDFIHCTAMAGQIQTFVHVNPENKILHTALVGEVNGYLHALTLGTPLENKWGALGGPRAYEKWIQEKPTPPDPQSQLRISPRPPDAPSGSAFLKQIESLDPPQREAAILEQITRGNVPQFLRALKPIRIQAAFEDGTKHSATCFVTGDYLAVGSDDDFFRIPMTPMTARAIADALDCSMITKKVSDEVYRQADLKLPPQPLTENREAAATFFQHHQMIEGQRVASKMPPGALIAGIKKDVVLSNRLSEKPHHVAIYGWHKIDGAPIQPLTVVHIERYVDYSHGVRLMSRHVMVDGKWVDAHQILRDSQKAILLSDEGAVDPGLYPATAH